MTATLIKQDVDRLKGLVPLKTLTDQGFNELLSDIVVLEEPRGTMLCYQGDTENKNIYLLDGTIALVVDKRVVDQVEGGSDTAKFPIAAQLPRKYDVRSMTKVRFVRIDNHRLSSLLAKNDDTSYEVEEVTEDSDDDWMAMLLESNLMQQIPPANIQGVMMRVEQVEVKEGEHIVRQGDPGDYYYILAKGTAVVTRDLGEDSQQELARFVPGTSFGEEALLSDSPRKASITMTSDGSLLRLSKQDFVELIQHPLSRSVDYPEAKAIIDQGGVWLDVRPQEEYEADHLQGSINLPFDSLRYQTGNLAYEHQYVVCCNDDSIAISTAFLLTEKGFHVSVLNGGFAAIDKEQGDDEPEAIEQADHSGELVERLADAESRVLQLEQQLEEQRKENAATEAGEDERVTYLDGQISVLKETISKKDGEISRLQEEITKERTRQGEIQSEMGLLQAEATAQEKRLEKLERELQGATDLAESAGDNIGDVKARLQKAMDDKDKIREQSDIELGRLKEEITELQMSSTLAEEDAEEYKAKAEALEKELAELRG